MDRSNLKKEIFSRVLFSSFELPHAFSRSIDTEVSRNRSLHSTDRRELTETLHDACRWRRRIWGDISPSQLADDRWIDRLTEAKQLHQNPPLAKWAALSMDALARELSFPTWLVTRWVQEMGFTSTVKLCLALNEPASVVLRVNVLKTDRTALKKALGRADIRTTEGKLSPWALYLHQRQNLRDLPLFRQGHFEIQDEASQMGALLTQAKPKDLVMDVCAGKGGKSLAVAAMMEDKGKIIALDSDSRVFDELKIRAKRAGVKSIETVWVAQDDPAPLSAHLQKVDVVMIDAPCSAFGVFRRRPWTKWMASPDTVDKFPARQISLLQRFAPLTRIGGRLVYITCTLHDRENQEIVSNFLTTETFELVENPRTYRPDVEGTDGFFMAAFHRTRR